MPRLCRTLLLAALVLSGCGSPRKSAEAALRKVGTDRVRKEAAVFYKNLFAGPAPTFFTIKLNDCPPAFQALAPLHVGAYPDGFSLAKVRTAEAEEGYYVIPFGMDIVPVSKNRAHFTPLTEGVYWYRFDL